MTGLTPTRAFSATLLLVSLGPAGARGTQLKTLPAAVATQVDFRRDIEPIFQVSCISCHGGEQQLGGLRLDNQTAALKGGNSGLVIRPGNSAESRMIRLVAGAGEILMPMTGERLTEQQVGLLRAWIDQGARWPQLQGSEENTGVKGSVQERQVGAAKTLKNRHWSFLPILTPPVPRVRNEAWIRNPIDAFILLRLGQEGISPSPVADRATLMRRVSLDLIGLPPSLEQQNDFERDNRTDAYQHLLDRLLESPHFGEKWALHWLDLARYADSDGYEKDNPRPHAWRYREWVVKAFNQNQPFDQFTIEQIAGDLIPRATVEQKVATGFHRNTLTNREGGIDLEEFRMESVVDRTVTVGNAWLGLTIGCARCHDHKYDPITQKDFYRLLAFFNTSQELNIEAPPPGEMGSYLRRRPEYEKKRSELVEEYGVLPLQEEWETKVREAGANPGVNVAYDLAWDVVGKMLDHGHDIIQRDRSQRTYKENEALTDRFIVWYKGVTPEKYYEELKFKELDEKIQGLHEEYPGLTEAQTIVEQPGSRETHILIRGGFRQRGIMVLPGIPPILPPIPDLPLTRTRLTLARWLLSEENPLMARVTVNRFWQELFGQGLVRTSGDFGTRGEQPSHPQLLDWLASEFMKDWDVKRLLKLMVNSATYRQSSRLRRDLMEHDPDNRLLARGSRFRLPSELIRDSALFVSGLLSTRIGGRSVRPPLPEAVAKLGFASFVKWETDEGANRYRRGLYTFFQRSVPYPQLMAFDMPDRLSTCLRRERSTTPIQALTLLNDPVFFEAAQALAVRLIREVPQGGEERLDCAFRLCLARHPNPAEKESLMRFYQQQKEMLEEAPESMTELFEATGIEGVQRADAAAWVGVSRVLLNLDEFINRE